MTRIVGGRAGGRRLRTPRGDATRPTSDRVREALFSSLEAAGALEGARVLDLYAGSGALGLEAWSRGAEHLTAVEIDRPTAALVRDNARAVGCTRVEVRATRVRAALTSLAGQAAQATQVEPTGRGPRFDLVLSDPPYDLPEADLAADLAQLVGLLDDDALVVVERSARSPEPTWPPGLAPERSRRYGETVLWYVRPSPEPVQEDEMHPDPHAPA